MWSGFSWAANTWEDIVISGSTRVKSKSTIRDSFAIAVAGGEPTERKRILNHIRSRVREIDPTADIILLGSRARGDAAPDSDWDILVLVDGSVDTLREDAVAHHLCDLELAEGVVISAIVVGRREWTSPVRRATPLYKCVIRRVWWFERGTIVCGAKPLSASEVKPWIAETKQLVSAIEILLASQATDLQP